MICAVFYKRDGSLYGFDVRGHAGSAAAGHDIVCAAVSSAVYLTANTLTEVCGCRAAIDEANGHLKLTVERADTEKAQQTLCGLQLHLQGLADQYPSFIQLQQTEV